jgi:hypothetical protein
MPTNNAERSVAESAEPRTGTKGNAGQQSTRRAQDRESVSQALDRVRETARQRKKEQFTSLLHHVDPAMLRTAFYAMKRDAAPGVDGMTWETYERDLDRKIEDLHARVKNGAYRALPSRRSYIPKEDGSKRPLAVAALEDKIVQRATAAVLSAIYEEDFLGFSYGFRPKRSQHDALDALIVGISSKKVNYILDADIRSFFTEVSQQWVIRFLKQRIGDSAAETLSRAFWLTSRKEHGHGGSSPNCLLRKRRHRKVNDVAEHARRSGRARTEDPHRRLRPQGRLDPPHLQRQGAGHGAAPRRRGAVC